LDIITPWGGENPQRYHGLSYGYHGMQVRYFYKETIMIIGINTCMVSNVMKMTSKDHEMKKMCYNIVGKKHHCKPGFESNKSSRKITTFNYM